MNISIIIPTYNSEKVLERCLQSIRRQDYPKENVEIIIADGGSKDQTLKIAQKYTHLIFPNPLKTGEAGKAVGLKHANHEICAFIDSDNILPESNWLTKMMEPFKDSEIIAAEPLFYTYRPQDYFITRYCALLGMNDPLCYFLGNYDRMNMLTRKWTEMPIVSKDEGSFLKIKFVNDQEGQIPTIGANGFFIRKSALDLIDIKDYFIDIDILPLILNQKGKEFTQVAKVKIGIIHLYCDSIRIFIRKQRRRICDYLYLSRREQRYYQWRSFPMTKLAKFIVYTILVVPLIFQSLKGFIRKGDGAWFFHPLACWITFYVYAFEFMRAKMKRNLLFYPRHS
ncbi:MAG: hypothetical protein A2Z91_03910 [Deltaproteobacteria bacterium GWA2_38_16]|nr:MAG: hypothetical protein A2Z91_03910 [Deltaproteobacteria bacterium GWA2_38_16]OGQ01853.1 MAG: hypothetical protein A3D19_03030 [Deltaproteobacteria bacterium RIFCSPHIGHO2_02_FULL_38_15]OGQ60777.1 MAG: hypothetical protein A3G92_05000 [Deltaproteobacteria bacterium RIFCSPLOWO2_12_FULL_38_8]HBQ20792.1 hypothetical protein [Deltaproteobacteria bacterium]